MPKVKPVPGTADVWGTSRQPSGNVFLPEKPVRQPGGDKKSPGNTVRLPGNPVFQPGDAVFLPGDAGHQPCGLIFQPGSPDFLPGNAKFLPCQLVFNQLRQISPPACRDWLKILAFANALNHQPSTIN
ncbi:MAG: hypothetical protein PHY43_09250 [Verrucomicrobiales bacterium]|nr:hypothetical protein [Verrucomicrobiales bacterium]